ncbi:DUF3240 family protein [Methylibium sp.]|uniref:DUF3240 family protein n=1 Tax=Methylibium sp. TaxID=2067992 RepID=UPI00286B17A6|nr:DUF3240 family protein [Methylibium sp.]
MPDAQSRYCLSMICAPEVEEKLLDALLSNVTDVLFTSTPAFDHGSAHGQLSSLEQVMGRSRAAQVQILLDADELASLLDLLRQDFKGTGLRYWATALHTEGEIA